MSRKRIIEKENFFLVEERKGSGPLIIQALGYTADEKAIREPWILTQIRTLPHLDRQHLPDPLIFKHNISAYSAKDCHVWTLYFRPECQGLEVALKEFAEYYANLPEKPILIGYSKGGLFFGALTDILESLDIILVAPTLRTITGDEQEMLRRLEEREKVSQRYREKFFIRLTKKLVKIIGSRRPIDKDMSIGSEFLNKHKLKNLRNNNSLLIIGTGSEESLTDRLCVKCGRLMNVSTDSDGVTENVEGVYGYRTVEVPSIHIAILEYSITQLEIFRFIVLKK